MAFEIFHPDPMKRNKVLPGELLVAYGSSDEPITIISARIVDQDDKSVAGNPTVIIRPDGDNVNWIVVFTGEFREKNDLTLKIRYCKEDGDIKDADRDFEVDSASSTSQTVIHHPLGGEKIPARHVVSYGPGQPLVANGGPPPDKNYLHVDPPNGNKIAPAMIFNDAQSDSWIMTWTNVPIMGQPDAIIKAQVVGQDQGETGAFTLI